MKVMHYCTKCDSTYSSETGFSQHCPKCHELLFETTMDSMLWMRMSDRMKEEYKKKWKIMFSEKEEKAYDNTGIL